jgi:alginate O-acetyltransferase complex protein AlgI
MLFNSFIFLELLIITFILYYIPFVRKYQVLVLVFSSLVFYAYHKPILLILLIGSFSFNAAASYGVYYGSANKRKLFATIGVIANLGLLFYYKYGPMAAATFFPSGSSIGEFLLHIPLPIGISFFTFEGISLLVDTYKNETEQKKHIDISKNFPEHLRNTALFVTFFPHLIAGPILKAYEYFPQIKEKKFGDIEWIKVVKFLILGYFLKMVVADNLKEQTMYMSFPQFLDVPSGTLVAMLYGYSIQIFSDFAGYSLIALGLAQLFGYTLTINFNYPYISSSFAEFWKRWHISLSTFLKEYLYYPLGGNRKGKLRTYFNLFIVMFLGGLWHGAAWSYAIWGLIHGLALAIERLIKDYVVIKPRMITKVLSIFFVFSYTSLAWLMFKFPKFSHVTAYLEAIYVNRNFGGLEFWRIMTLYNILYSLPVLLYYAYYLYKQAHTNNPFAKYEYVAYGALLFLIITNSGVSGDFIYFQF